MFSRSEITALGSFTAVYSPGGLSIEGIALIEPRDGIVDSQFIRESDNSFATSVKLSSVTLNVPAEPLLCTYGETTRVSVSEAVGREIANFAFYLILESSVREIQCTSQHRICPYTRADECADKRSLDKAYPMTLVFREPLIKLPAGGGNVVE